MAPELHPHFAPGQVDVRVMLFLLGDGAHAVREVEGVTEIGELEIPFQVVFVHDDPSSIQLLAEPFDLLALERWCFFAAGRAGLAGQI